MSAPSMSTAAQPEGAMQMKIMSGGEGKKSTQCIAGEKKPSLASRIRGGGAAKDCFIGLFACFVCFECCEGCCECIADIICCPCELCCDAAEGDL